MSQLSRLFFRHLVLALSIFISSMLVGSAAHAAAGGGDSGGGSVVVCRTSSGKIESVQLLDLFEGQIRHKHVHPKLDIPHTQIIDQLIPRLSFAHFETPMGPKNLPEELSNSLQNLLARTELLPMNVALNQPSDLGVSHAIIVPDGCRVEAVGFREASGSLVIASSLYNSMSNTHKAAFWMHEALYSIYTRTNMLSSSEGTWPLRKLVSALFATNTGLRELADTASFFFHRVDPFDPGNSPVVQTHIFLDIAQADARLKFGYRIGMIENIDPSAIPSEFMQYLGCGDQQSSITTGNALPVPYMMPLLELSLAKCRNQTAHSVQIFVSNKMNLEGTSARDGMTVLRILDQTSRLLMEVQSNPIVIRRRPVRSTLGFRFDMKANFHFMQDRPTYQRERALAASPF